MVTLGLIISLLILAAFAPHSAPSVTTNEQPTMVSMGVSDDPNAVTAAFSVAAYTVNRSLNTTARRVHDTMQSIATAASHAGSSMARGVANTTRAIGHGIYCSIAAVGHGIGNGARFIGRLPGSLFGYVAHASVVDAVIKPADHNPVPIIDPRSPDLIAAKEALPIAQATAATPAVPQVIWPLHGQITTQFGVPEWPYQAVHTGLDIADGQTPGVTPIKAFRSGRVITTETQGGLGNHVVIDHGSGVTSVYGHLASIAVQVGQEVDAGTIIGHEGTTGVSTGPHLHFEIRVNGQATDPHQFIAGQPYD